MGNDEGIQRRVSVEKDVDTGPDRDLFPAKPPEDNSVYDATFSLFYFVLFL